jgi:hypothetical protein
MKIGKRFNELEKSEYFHFMQNDKKHSDFNTLGMYKSICENKRLSLTDKIEVRDYANKSFGKTLNFYPLKDPQTYFDLMTLGREMTVADIQQAWTDIRRNQETILSDKKIKHRNFGEYSKHNCGDDDCPYNGLMIKQGYGLAESQMHFKSDKKETAGKDKAARLKKERKIKHGIIRDELDDGSK